MRHQWYYVGCDDEYDLVGYFLSLFLEMNIYVRKKVLLKT